MAWNPESKTGSDSHTWVGKGLVSFFATFSVVISASQEILFIIQMTISTLEAQDSSQTKSFVTHEEFEDYIEQISNNS